MTLAGVASARLVGFDIGMTMGAWVWLVMVRRWTGQNVDMSVNGELRYLLIPGGGGSGPDHHLHLGSDALLDTWPEGRIYLRELVGRARSFNQHVDSL